VLGSSCAWHVCKWCACLGPVPMVVAAHGAAAIGKEDPAGMPYRPTLAWRRPAGAASPATRVRHAAPLSASEVLREGLTSAGIPSGAASAGRAAPKRLGLTFRRRVPDMFALPIGARPEMFRLSKKETKALGSTSEPPLPSRSRRTPRGYHEKERGDLWQFSGEEHAGPPARGAAALVGPRAGRRAGTSEVAPADGLVEAPNLGAAEEVDVDKASRAAGEQTAMSSPPTVVHGSDGEFGAAAAAAPTDAARRRPSASDGAGPDATAASGAEVEAPKDSVGAGAEAPVFDPWAAAVAKARQRAVSASASASTWAPSGGARSSGLPPPPPPPIRTPTPVRLGGSRDERAGRNRPRAGLVDNAWKDYLAPTEAPPATPSRWDCFKPQAAMGLPSESTVLTVRITNVSNADADYGGITCQDLYKKLDPLGKVEKIAMGSVRKAELLVYGLVQFASVERAKRILDFFDGKSLTDDGRNIFSITFSPKHKLNIRANNERQFDFTRHPGGREPSRSEPPQKEHSEATPVVEETIGEIWSRHKGKLDPQMPDSRSKSVPASRFRQPSREASEPPTTSLRRLETKPQSLTGGSQSVSSDLCVKVEITKLRWPRRPSSLGGIHVSQVRRACSECGEVSRILCSVTLRDHENVDFVEAAVEFSSPSNAARLAKKCLDGRSLTSDAYNIMRVYLTAQAPPMLEANTSWCWENSLAPVEHACAEACSFGDKTLSNGMPVRQNYSATASPASRRSWPQPLPLRSEDPYAMEETSEEDDWHFDGTERCQDCCFRGPERQCLERLRRGAGAGWCSTGPRRREVERGQATSEEQRQSTCLKLFTPLQLPLSSPPTLEALSGSPATWMTPSQLVFALASSEGSPVKCRETDECGDEVPAPRHPELAAWLGDATLSSDEAHTAEQPSAEELAAEAPAAEASAAEEEVPEASEAPAPLLGSWRRKRCRLREVVEALRLTTQELADVEPRAAAGDWTTLRSGASCAACCGQGCARCMSRSDAAQEAEAPGSWQQDLQYSAWPEQSGCDGPGWYCPSPWPLSSLAAEHFSSQLPRRRLPATETAAAAAMEAGKEWIASPQHGPSEEPGVVPQPIQPPGMQFAQSSTEGGQDVASAQFQMENFSQESMQSGSVSLPSSAGSAGGIGTVPDGTCGQCGIWACSGHIDPLSSTWYCQDCWAAWSAACGVCF